MISVFKNKHDWDQFRQLQEDKSIGLVTTMGNLHDGHAKLLGQSISSNDITVLTIFVNPTQFNNKNDLSNYPKTLDQDIALAEKIGVDAVLLPTYEELYPDNYQYRISENQISSRMEGVHRPAHFDGMMTVVMKLFNLVKPTRTYFGEKDYQQLQLVQGMVKAFLMDIDVIGVPTVRNEAGLALSSRNNRLTEQQQMDAQYFPEMLAKAELSDEQVIQQLESKGFEVEYIKTRNNRRFGAINVAGVRLIDNIELLQENIAC